MQIKSSHSDNLIGMQRFGVSL